jgi:hypothetical protein
MIDKEEDIELDLEVGAKVLSTVQTKKKAKPKGRQKKAKDESLSKGTSKATALPLSMLPPAEEDLTQYSLKLTQHRNDTEKAIPYKISKYYKVGDIIQHKTFGIGFVVVEAGRNKVEVLFQSGRKLLVNGAKPA